MRQRDLSHLSLAASVSRLSLAAQLTGDQHLNVHWSSWARALLNSSPPKPIGPGVICTKRHRDGEREGLIEAAAAGLVAGVCELLDQGADPNARDEDGWFPLLAASLSGSREVVAALLNTGADVNAQAPDGSTALLKATLWRHVDIVRLLLERGAKVHLADERGWTAVGVALLIEHRELVDLLRRHAR